MPAKTGMERRLIRGRKMTAAMRSAAVLLRDAKLSSLLCHYNRTSTPEMPVIRLRAQPEGLGHRPLPRLYCGLKFATAG